jgi:putative oxidoreductase
MIKIGHPFSRYSEEAYSLLRIVAGFLFSFHGAQKILGLLTDSGMMPPVGSELWFGGLIELVCGLLILVGFLTPYVAFLASGEMAVAYFQFHWKFASGDNFFPIVNHGEMAVVYCFLFLFIAAKGGGKWSVDGSMPVRR